MKKSFLSGLAALLLFGMSCQKQDKTSENTQEPETADRKCASQEVLDAQLAADPSRAARMDEIEAFTRRYMADQGQSARTNAISIPVVVHVVYNTASQNISDAQIQSQIAVLNEDFNLANADHSLVPSHFAGVKANVGIQFTLDRVIRKATSKRSFGTNDAIKKSSLGGSDAVDPSNYLNIWVGNLSNGLLGYAQFPGGPAATDGVVCLYSAFGRTGTLVANYNKGRTATHEVGHWLNLRHIWGDATCGNDLVGDTPVHNTSNGGCPSADHRSTCTGTPLEMWMNYMDYTYDACMYMFTTGQSTRMNAVFAAGGPRASFAN
ncbi:MAG TPA: zinc metalloprotease [Flavisolibacter sp.]